MSQITVVILAAGLGTRMKSRRPKVLHEILGRPMIVPVVELALGMQPQRIVLVVGHGREEIQAALTARYPDAPLLFALQQEQLGTGHAMQCAVTALGDLSGRILVLYGDVPNLTPDTVHRMVARTEASQSPIGLLGAHLTDPTGYGRLLRDDQGRLVGVVEERDASDSQKAIREINAGLYLFEAGFLNEAIGCLDRDNVSGELYLTDLVALAARTGRHAVTTSVQEPLEILGINSRTDLARAVAYARSLRNQRLMEQGVTLVDPERTYVDFDVQLAADTILWPGATLRGDTVVDRDVEIETGAVIKDCSIGEGARILAYSHLEGAQVGPGAVVGPFARIRPGSRIDSRVSIGNFVELKKCLIGEGSKANHLSYLGDAVIGRQVNVGAGTITCNYDGRHKHTTTIEDGVFIGSDTQLVAPVTVHAGAVIGAGTTVTQEVPPGALALSRVPQRNLEGYAHKKRQGES